MEEHEARKVLEPWIGVDDSINTLDLERNCDFYAWWVPTSISITLDGYFTAEQLEAIAWWMRNKKIGEDER